MLQEYLDTFRSTDSDKRGGYSYGGGYGGGNGLGGGYNNGFGFASPDLFHAGKVTFTITFLSS